MERRIRKSYGQNASEKAEPSSKSRADGKLARRSDIHNFRGGNINGEKEKKSKAKEKKVKSNEQD